MNLDIIAHNGLTMKESPFEVVERKGRGHPDTICDLLADRVSRDLGQCYLEQCGHVLHYNVDKALLVGGKSQPVFGGGRIVEPARLYLGDRAISSLNGRRFDLDGVIEGSISSWLEENLRFLKLKETLVWNSEIREGAASLNSVEDRNLSNDTSVGVGFWPLSSLEELALAVEEHMNSSSFKRLHPAAGEDIKVMAVRRGKAVETIIACALVGKYVASVEVYQTTKQIILRDVTEFLNTRYGKEFNIAVTLNALDDHAQGADGLYLTVTGLSCEGGDSGQVGRGNRVNGLISFLGPQTMEAWAGKNFKSRVGKVYSFAAQNLARKITEEMAEVKEANVLLVGRIGSPVDQPAHVFADVKTWGHCHSAVQEKAAAVLNTAICDGAVFLPQHLFVEPASHNSRDHRPTRLEGKRRILS